MGRCGHGCPAALSVVDNGSASVEPDDLTCCRIKLTLLGHPSRTAVDLICHGHGCPFASRTFRPTSSKFKLAGALKHSHLSPHATVEVEITAPDDVGEVVIFTIRSNQQPTETYRCLPPGTRSPAACA